MYDQQAISTIFKAAQNGNLTFFQEIINDKAFKELVFTSSYTKSGDTALHYAVRHGHLDVVKFLVNEGFILDIGNFDGKRPLHEAVQFGQTACLKFLLAQKDNVDALKRADWTPLMLACTKDDLSVVQILVEHGANLNLKNKDGWNCFHIAVRDFRVKICKVAVNNKEPGQTACKCRLAWLFTGGKAFSIPVPSFKALKHLDLLDREGHLPIVEYLLQQDTQLWDTASKNGRTPLHTAALHGHNDVLEYLLNVCTYETDVKDSCGSTPFMDALRIQDIDSAKLLISKHKADVTVEDNLGRQALHVASQTGAFQSVQYLVEDCKVDPAVTCSGNGASALHIAAKEGHVSVLQLFLDFGVDSNITDTKGRTALHIAAGAQHADCVRVLLLHGADCRPDHSGTSPKQLAVKQEVTQVFEEFQST